MKKNIIIAVIAAASALLLSVSCQKDDQLESQSGINGGKIFTASIEQSLTKTTLTSAYKVNWTDGDIININGVTFKATLDGTDATNATFAKDPDSQNDPTGETFNAIYPSTLYVSDHFALPATQTYSAGAFNAPMYAESETQTLTFKNICAVLAIKVTREDIATLKSIKVKADKKLHGTFTVASTTDGYKATIGTDGTEEVVLSSSNAITLTSEGTTFYIAIPEQEYSYLKIYLSEDGTLYKRAMITKQAAGLGTIDCNKIYNIDYETNAVQIYANGPYWSTMNIGATKSTEEGWYFSWANTTGYKHIEGSWVEALNETNTLEGGFTAENYQNTDGSKLNTNYSPTSGYDASRVHWGEGWRVPNTSNDFRALIDNTTRSNTSNYEDSGLKGKIVTGKDSYNDISLFLPAQGNGYGNSISEYSFGFYESCVYKSEIQFTYLYFRSTDGNFKINDGDRYRGKPVRPVSD